MPLAVCPVPLFGVPGVQVGYGRAVQLGKVGREVGTVSVGVVGLGVVHVGYVGRAVGLVGVVGREVGLGVEVGLVHVGKVGRDVGAAVGFAVGAGVASAFFVYAMEKGLNVPS